MTPDNIGAESNDEQPTPLMHGSRALPDTPLRWRDWIAVDAKPQFRTAMSTVWRVRREASADVFALKTLRFRKGSGSTAYQRFEREIAILSRIGAKPGIVEVIDHSLLSPGDDGELFYVMPWAETSLERASKALVGQLERVLVMGIAIAEALGAAHDAGVIHRDVKPANVLLYGDEQQPRVADFGIGYLAEEDRLTKDGANTVGTDDFVAPELRGGGQSDSVAPTADVYSLGKTLYAIVSGGTVLPREWLDDPRFELTLKFKDHRFEHLNGLLRRMITERPGDRYQTMAQCRAAFANAIDNMREGIRFRAQMYGGLDSPEERFVRLSRRMDEISGHRRQDAIQDAQRAAMDATRTVAEETGATQGAMQGRLNSAMPAGMKGAEDAAEQLMAVGLALVQHNELEGLAEWLSELVQAVRTREDAESIGARWILPPSAAVAVHGVGALAWHRRRFQALRQLVDAQLQSPGRWIHHYVLGDSAAAVIPWVNEVLARSPTLRRAEPALQAPVADSTSAVAGLVTLRAFIDFPPDRLDAWFASNEQYSLLDAYPGLCYQTAQWASVFPREFAARPGLERDIATHLFDATPEEFRASCSRVTPALARVVTSIARGQNRSPMWVRRVFGESWTQWCGGIGY
jgi:hypothetical protein